MKNIKHGLWWLFVGLCLGLTPYIFSLADIERGYDATGGEIFFPLIPVMAWLIFKTIKDFKYQKDERMNEND